MCVTGLLPGGLCVRYSVRIVILVRVKYSDDPSWKHVEFCRIVEDMFLETRGVLQDCGGCVAGLRGRGMF